jgi:hypothetical protein
VSRPRALAFLVTLLVSLFALPAFAEDKKIEAEVKALQKKAIEEDSLATDYAAATKKLQDALKKCGADKCTPKTKAEVLRDLGAMQILDKKIDDGQASFLEALKIDRDLQLAAEYKSPAIEALWDQVKKKLPPPTTPQQNLPPGGGTPTGDFTHTPFDSQQVRTPLPIFVEYGGSETLARVVVKYKGFGMTEFKTLELTKQGKGFGAVIPCLDVTEGEFKYYLQGFNASNDPVATSGNRNETYKVKITKDAPAEAPSLPGQPPPTQCRDTSECPPDFPGCKGGGSGEEQSKKDDGESCDENAQCKSGSCKNEKCEASSAKIPRFWVGAAVSYDLVFLGTAENVCKLDNQTAAPLNAGYYCFDPNGNADYPVRTQEANEKIILNQLNQVKGGVAPGTLRLMLSFDVALNTNLLIGARLGLVLNTFPGQVAKDEGAAFFAPVHLEARGTYLIGKDALIRPGFAPYAMLGVGASEFAAKVAVSVREQGVSQPRSVDAYGLGGPFFVSVGGGGRYAFSPRAAMMFGLKFNAAFGVGGMLPSLAPEVGVQFGF